jgi:hypothetical protein
MKNSNQKLPKKQIRVLYSFRKADHKGPENSSSGGDTMTTCTTVVTTTHINRV